MKPPWHCGRRHEVAVAWSTPLDAGLRELYSEPARDSQRAAQPESARKADFQPSRRRTGITGDQHLPRVEMHALAAADTPRSTRAPPARAGQGRCHDRTAGTPGRALLWRAHGLRVARTCGTRTLHRTGGQPCASARNGGLHLRCARTRRARTRLPCARVLGGCAAPRAGPGGVLGLGKAAARARKMGQFPRRCIHLGKCPIECIVSGIVH